MAPSACAQLRRNLIRETGLSSDRVTMLRENSAAIARTWSQRTSMRWCLRCCAARCASRYARWAQRFVWAQQGSLKAKQLLAHRPTRRLTLLKQKPGPRVPGQVRDTRRPDRAQARFQWSAVGVVVGWAPSLVAIFQIRLNSGLSAPPACMDLQVFTMVRHFPFEAAFVIGGPNAGFDPLSEISRRDARGI